MDEYSYGWRPELEAQHTPALATMMRPMCAAPPGGLKHDSVDPRPFIPCNDQRRRNSCEGNSRAKIGEYCNWVETGVWTKLSARYSYLTTRIVDGTNSGPDEGASISGGALASKQYGECTEAIFPYWQDSEQFTSRIPAEASDMGSQHRLRSTTPLRGASDTAAFIDMGLGGGHFGIMWTQGLAQFRGEFLDHSQAGGGVLGGHALAILGFIMRGGEPWLIMYNSHSAAWGKDGTAVVEPRLFDYWMANSPFGIIGMSDLPDFGGGPRPFKSWEGILG